MKYVKTDLFVFFEFKTFKNFVFRIFKFSTCSINFGQIYGKNNLK